MIEDKVYNLGLWDTAGQEEYDKMRTVSYPHTDVFVLCFSLVHPMSFENVRNRWYPELKEYCPESPILLVGTKLDLTTDEATMQALTKQGLAPVGKDAAQSLSKELHLAGYLECSGMTQAGVKVVFDEAARLAVGKPLLVANKISKSPSISRIRTNKPMSSTLSSVSSTGNSKKKACAIL